VRLARIIERFEKVSVLVIGDLMIDRFIWGRVSRISPEAPVPVVRQERESQTLGGAANVARNIAMLGATAIPAGVRGGDPEGEEFERICREAGLSTKGLVVDPGRHTTLKMRVIAHHQHVVRVDREEERPLQGKPAEELKEHILGTLERVQVVVVSDYDKGCITPELLQSILPEAERRGLPIVIDPKVRLFRHYRPATVVTPNAREAMEAAGISARSDKDFELVGRKLMDLIGCPHLLITRGEHGMMLFDVGGVALTVPTMAREVFDVTGAGDTVTATLALALAGGAEIGEAAMLANQAAGLVVGKVGTAAPTPAELLSRAGAPPSRSAGS
jgi:D-beta-D-heptose 7-phosphate kinase/D-beta-D-heptose 1-phosphate adenosyltransferase